MFHHEQVLTSTMGPITKKAITGANPKLDSSDAPIKASASEHRERRKASNIISKIAVNGL